MNHCCLLANRLAKGASSTGIQEDLHWMGAFTAECQRLQVKSYLKEKVALMELGSAAA